MTEHFYQRVRNLAESVVKYFEFRATNGSPVVRIPVTDSRINHQFNQIEKTMVYSIVFHGGDADIPLPTTINRILVYATVDATNAEDDVTIEPLTIDTLGANYTIGYKLPIPPTV